MTAYAKAERPTMVRGMNYLRYFAFKTKTMRDAWLKRKNPYWPKKSAIDRKEIPYDCLIFKAGDPQSDAPNWH